MQGKPTLVDELCEGAKRMETLRLDFGDLPDDVIRITLRTAAECFTDAATRLATYEAALRLTDRALKTTGVSNGAIREAQEAIRKALEDNK